MEEQKKLSFIYKAKPIRINYEDAGTRLGSIPVHSSYDIENVLVINTDDDKQMILVNKQILSDMESLDIDSMIMHVLTRMTHTEDTNSIIADVFVANWFGYSRMIKLVKTFEHDEVKKHKRIDRLERAVISNLEIKFPEKDEIINNFNFI